ncbi:tRNA-modifying protein YgfZ [Gammaproteobacteria bacterium]
MNAQWQDFLVKEGAELQDGIVAHFGNPAQECAVAAAGNVMVDLSHQGLIGIEGADAATFLQGQVTCDIREIGPNVSRLGAWCNPKGRVRVTFRVFQREEGFYLAVPVDCVEDTLKQLRKYVLRSKVALRDASCERIRLGCSGATIEERLRQFFPIIPGESDQVVQEGSSTIIRLRGPLSRFEIFGEIGTMVKLWDTLRVHTAAIGAGAWSTLEVLSGVAVVTHATSEAFVPHMLNLPEIGAVNFRKGCYTGQEVVARTQYLGKSKRRLYLARIAGEKSPRLGDPLWVPPEGEEQTPGQVVNIAPAPEGGFLVLAVIAVADVRRGEIYLRDCTGPLLELRALPYPFLEERDGPL